MCQISASIVGRDKQKCSGLPPSSVSTPFFPSRVSLSLRLFRVPTGKLLVVWNIHSFSSFSFFILLVLPFVWLFPLSLSLFISIFLSSQSFVSFRNRKLLTQSSSIVKCWKLTLHSQDPPPPSHSPPCYDDCYNPPFSRRISFEMNKIRK